MARTIDWKAIRLAFEHDGVTNVSELARRFRVSRESIKQHRDGEHGESWQPGTQVIAKVTTNVVNILTKRALDAIPKGTVERIASDLSEHPRLARKLVECANLILDDFIEGRLTAAPNQSMADVFNAIAAGLKRTTDLGRDVHGIKPGEASDKVEDDGDEKRVTTPVFIVRSSETKQSSA
jgi:hypothetical protein